MYLQVFGLNVFHSTRNQILQSTEILKFSQTLKVIESNLEKHVFWPKKNF